MAFISAIIWVCMAIICLHWSPMFPLIMPLLAGGFPAFGWLCCARAPLAVSAATTASTGSIREVVLTSDRMNVLSWFARLSLLAIGYRQARQCMWREIGRASCRERV